MIFCLGFGAQLQFYHLVTIQTARRSSAWTVDILKRITQGQPCLGVQLTLGTTCFFRTTFFYMKQGCLLCYPSWDVFQSYRLLGRIRRGSLSHLADSSSCRISKWGHSAGAICERAHLYNQKEMGLISNIPWFSVQHSSAWYLAAFEATRQACRFSWWGMPEDVLQHLRCLWGATLICRCPHVAVLQEGRFYCTCTDWAPSQHMLVVEDLLCCC